MKRIQLFEFEDQKWFPSWLRSSITRLIVVFLRLMGTSEVLAGLIAKVLKEQKLSTIVDLGSGSGGAMPEVLRLLKEKYGLTDSRLVMTDLYPNPNTLQYFNGKNDDSVRYHHSSVDATNISSAPKGLKTMVNCFHHMPPEAARKILVSAQQNKQPILIYELAENNIPLLVWILFLPISLLILIIMVFFMTPFVKPLTWQQLVFTYIIPVIPICYAWDGQASLPRIYSMKDMDQLLPGLASKEYVWEKGVARGKNNKKAGTFLLGMPV